MKKLLLTTAIIAVLLVGSSSAFAYSTVLLNTLTSPAGNVSITLGLWNPTDSASPYHNTGYWGYEYTVKNTNYDTFLNYISVDSTGSAPIILMGSPLGWNYTASGTNFEWTATPGYQLNTGMTQSGFNIKSLGAPTTRGILGWTTVTPPVIPAVGTGTGPGANPVPEPGSAMLLGMGVLSMFGAVIRKKFKA